MRITNWHLEFGMKLRKGILSLLLIFLAAPSFSKGLIGSNYTGIKGSKLYFLDDSVFKNTDTSLFLGRSGLWKMTGDKISLETKINDSTVIRDTLQITYKSESKISLYNGSKYFTFKKKHAEREESYFTSITKGIIGMTALLFLAYLFSSSRRNINWPLVFKGVLLQLVLALLILKAPYVEGVFDFLSRGFVKVVDMAHHGAEFVFGSFIDGKVNPYIKNFATWILPSVIFFSALTSLLYYWGILQKVVIGMAWLMKRVMGISGAESVSAAGNIFLGQTEAPLLVKPYLGRMTKSEILCLMVGGMATIAGGVLASYIGFLGGEDPQQKIYFAKHLLTASLMSAPAAIVFAKMLYPETEKINPDLSVEKEKLGANALEAVTNGTTDGLKLAVNVGAMLIVFISLVALANYLLGKFGYYTGLNDIILSWGHYQSLSFEAILGYSLSPLAWMMGVPWNDCLIVGQLLGEKTILNEFVAYGNLATLKFYLSDKAVLMTTYVLCGFANFASIGIQVGGIGSLAPERKSTLAKFGIKALIGGTLACMSTAVIAGMLY
jgi:concentrative nucleoside transporter, CNT family